MTISPNKEIIEGIQINDAYPIFDERGSIYHFIRDDDDIFKKFGEVYFSNIYKNTIKAWHLHKKMTLNYICIYGMIKLVVYDDRENSKTRGLLNEFFIGEYNPKIITIPPMIYNGFKNYGDKNFSIVSNFTDIHHSSDEILRFPVDCVNYDWSCQNG